MKRSRGLLVAMTTERILVAFVASFVVASLKFYPFFLLPTSSLS